MRMRTCLAWLCLLALGGCNYLVDSRLSAKEFDGGSRGDADADTGHSDTAVFEAGDAGDEASGDGAQGSAMPDGEAPDAGAENGGATMGDGGSSMTTRDTDAGGEGAADAEDEDAGGATPPSRKDLVGCAGLNHGCLLQPDGSLQCFGSNQEAARSPVGEFSDVACGEGHVCALHADTGNLECWGDNGGGQTVEKAQRFTAVAAGQAHTCALDEAGKVSCWGADDMGQSTPPPDTRFVDVAAGHDFTCGIREADRGAECWGNQAGLRTRPPAGERFVSLVLSGDYGCGVTEEERLHCWGHQAVAGYDGIPAESAAANDAIVCSIFQESVDCEERETGPFSGLWFFTEYLNEGRWALLFAGYRSLCGVPMNGPVVCGAMGVGTSVLIDQGTTIRLPPDE